MTETPHVFLKPGREASVLRKHPWLFSRGVGRTEGNPQPGSLVAVHKANGDFLAWGHYSPQSQIRVRFVSWNEADEPDSEAFLRSRLKQAITARTCLWHNAETTAFRLINAESDGIPGLVLDRYGDTLVLQALTVGIESRREMLVNLLLELFAHDPFFQSYTLRSIYERSDADVRKKEGLKPRTGLLAGEEPPAHTEILENGLRFLVDVRAGHKSGFYLDQRENRQRLRETITDLKRAGKTIALLNVFSYTGGFALYGLAGGAATVVNVDASADVLALMHKNLACNHMENAATEEIADDAFKVLRKLRQEDRQFDIIVLDPPKFAFTERDIRRASRGYKDINLQALHLLKPGGLLFTYSCSGAISASLFQKIIFGAALDSGRDTQIIGCMSQSSDHPVSLTFPEGTYLKGLLCRVIK